MSIVIGAVFVVGAYLIGSIPFGVVLARSFSDVDVRTVGSGNIGASNVARTVGKGVGSLTLLLDAAKAALPMLVARAVIPGEGGKLVTVLIGLAAFFGHLFPVWLGFKGGKGVATALGVFLVLAPIPALLGLALFGVAYGLTRVAAVGSLCGTFVCCVGAVAQEIAAYGRDAWRTAVPWAALLVTVLIFLRHRSNIVRLIQGTENQV